MSLLTNLISYWKLDEASGTRYDTHSTNDLTDNNSVSSTTGKINSAASFDDASTQYLSHATNSDLESGDIDWTITAWVYVQSGSQLFNDHIFVGKDQSLAREYAVGWTGFGDWGYLAQFNGTAVFNSDLTINTWRFVVAWHDSVADTLNIQVDNGTVSSVATGGIYGSPGIAPFQIGSRSYAGSEGYCKGYIDEVGFWKRVLTSQERTDLFGGGAGLAYPFSSSTGYIPRILSGGKLSGGGILTGGIM